MAEWMNEITCSEFTTHSAPSGWELHFRTPKQEDYIAVQDLCRKLIGHGKPLTNADRIRSLSDEELAFIFASPSVEIPPWCVPHLECPHMDKDPVPCDECALDWLRQESDNGESN